MDILRRLLLWLICICVMLAPSLAGARVYHLQPPEREAAFVFEYGPLFDGQQIVYDPDFSYLLADLSRRAYTLDTDGLADLGFYDLVVLRTGLIDGEDEDLLRTLLRKVSIDSVPATNGFICLRDIQVDGRDKTMVLVCFSGTMMENPIDLTDWLRDLQYASEDGMHAGYALGMRGLMALESEVHFPTLNSTLDQVLQACIEGSQDYLVVLTGHSMGGGIANLYAYELQQRGLPQGSMLAYTYASPLTVVQDFPSSSGQCPSLNLINDEDLITYVGVDIFSGRRLGRDIVVHLSDAFKQAHGMQTGTHLLSMIRLLQAGVKGGSFSLTTSAILDASDKLNQIYEAHEPQTYVDIAKTFSGEAAN